MSRPAVTIMRGDGEEWFVVEGASAITGDAGEIVFSGTLEECHAYREERRADEYEEPLTSDLAGYFLEMAGGYLAYAARLIAKTRRTVDLDVAQQIGNAMGTSRTDELDKLVDDVFSLSREVAPWRWKKPGSL